MQVPRLMKQDAILTATQVYKPSYRLTNTSSILACYRQHAHIRIKISNVSVESQKYASVSEFHASAHTSTGNRDYKAYRRKST